MIKVCKSNQKVCTYFLYELFCVHRDTNTITIKRCTFCAHPDVTKNRMYAHILHYHINKLDKLPFLSWRKDRSRPASSSTLLCRMDMPIVKMNLNCEMIASGGPAAASPPPPGRSQSHHRARVSSIPPACAHHHIISQFERRKGRSTEPAAGAAGAAARPVPVTSPSPTVSST